jgi:hypothetical protein
MLALALLCAAAVGCSTTAVQNFAGNVPGGMSREQVRDAITQAAKLRQWTVQEQSQTELLATLVIRNKHSATVTISYDTQRYAIAYRDSTNLDYEDGQIHENYNAWVTKLDRTIQKELHRAAGAR